MHVKSEPQSAFDMLDLETSAFKEELFGSLSTPPSGKLTCQILIMFDRFLRC